MNPVLQCFSTDEVGVMAPIYDVGGHGAWVLDEDGKTIKDDRQSRISVPLRVLTEEQLVSAAWALLLKAATRVPGLHSSRNVWGDIQKRREDLGINEWVSLTRDHSLSLAEDELLAVGPADFTGRWVRRGSGWIPNPTPMQYSSGIFLPKDAPVLLYRVTWQNRYERELEF